MSNALDDLIAKVEAEDHRVGMWQVLDDEMNPHAPEYARQAYLGSLDAALALHNAVLPGWGFDVSEYSASVSNRYTAAGYSGYRFFDAENIDDNPARAWLLAILRAMKEQAND